MLLPDFKLLRKSGSVLPRSTESLDLRVTADSRLRISGSLLKLRVDRSGASIHRSSVGIIVALAVGAFWPEPSAIAAKNAAVQFFSVRDRRGGALSQRFEARIVA